MSIYWCKRSDVMAGSVLEAKDRDSGMTFTITNKYTHYQLKVKGMLYGDVIPFNETWDYKTVGACKSFVTRHFGR